VKLSEFPERFLGDNPHPFILYERQYPPQSKKKRRPT
jgi:hypothetical protein